MEDNIDRSQNSFSYQNSDITKVFWYLYFLLHFNLRGLFKAKAVLVEEQYWYNLTDSKSGGDKEVHTFPKGISSKVIVIARMELDLAYFDVMVQQFTYYVTGTPPGFFFISPFHKYPTKDFI